MLEEIIRAGVVLPAPELESEPNMPPAVPPGAPPSACSRPVLRTGPSANKDVWNYMGSPLLLEAVEDKAVSQMEAEMVMEIASYRRSVNYTALATGLSPAKRQRSPAPSGERVLELYESGIIKLRRWLSR